MRYKCNFVARFFTENCHKLSENFPQNRFSDLNFLVIVANFCSKTNVSSTNLPNTKEKIFSWIFSKDYLQISEGACDWNLFEIFLLIFYCWFYLDFCVDFKIQSENHEKIYSKILWGIKKSFRSFLAQKSWENLKLKSGWKSE